MEDNTFLVKFPGLRYITLGPAVIDAFLVKAHTNYLNKDLDILSPDGKTKLNAALYRPSIKSFKAPTDINTDTQIAEFHCEGYDNNTGSTGKISPTFQSKAISILPTKITRTNTFVSRSLQIVDDDDVIKYAYLIGTKDGINDLTQGYETSFHEKEDLSFNKPDKNNDKYALFSVRCDPVPQVITFTFYFYTTVPVKDKIDPKTNSNFAYIGSYQAQYNPYSSSVTNIVTVANWTDMYYDIDDSTKEHQFIYAKDVNDVRMDLGKPMNEILYDYYTDHRTSSNTTYSYIVPEPGYNKKDKDSTMWMFYDVTDIAVKHTFQKANTFFTKYLYEDPDSSWPEPEYSLNEYYHSDWSTIVKVQGTPASALFSSNHNNSLWDVGWNGSNVCYIFNSHPFTFCAYSHKDQNVWDGKKYCSSNGHWSEMGNLQKLSTTNEWDVNEDTFTFTFPINFLFVAGKDVHSTVAEKNDMGWGPTGPKLDNSIRFWQGNALTTNYSYATAKITRTCASQKLNHSEYQIVPYFYQNGFNGLNCNVKHVKEVTVTNEQYSQVNAISYAEYTSGTIGACVPTPAYSTFQSKKDREEIPLYKGANKVTFKTDNGALYIIKVEYMYPNAVIWLHSGKYGIATSTVNLSKTTVPECGVYIPSGSNEDGTFAYQVTFGVGQNTVKCLGGDERNRGYFVGTGGKTTIDITFDIDATDEWKKSLQTPVYSVAVYTLDETAFDSESDMLSKIKQLTQNINGLVTDSTTISQLNQYVVFNTAKVYEEKQYVMAGEECDDIRFFVSRYMFKPSLCIETFGSYTYNSTNIKGFDGNLVMEKTYTGDTFTVPCVTKQN